MLKMNLYFSRRRMNCHSTFMKHWWIMITPSHQKCSLTAKNHLKVYIRDTVDAA